VTLAAEEAEAEGLVELEDGLQAPACRSPRAGDTECEWRKEDGSYLWRMGMERELV
jgi:hypothetical protein